MLDASRLARTLTRLHGVALDGEARDDDEGQHVQLWPTTLLRTRGFIVDVLIGWRTIRAEVVPGSFARKVLTAMSQCTPDRRAAFGVFVRASKDDGAHVALRINDTLTDPLRADAWPTDWRSFSLGFEKGPLDINVKDPEALFALSLRWGGRALCSALALLELEPLERPADAEGGAFQELVTRYERSASNRAACIEIFGPKCKVCGFDFETEFGDIGAGFIEVHHTELVSRLEAGTVLDPSIDLVPLCANCHRMAHRRIPPYETGELRAILDRRSSASRLAQ